MVKEGQILLGTDGQAYRVAGDLRAEQGSLRVVGKDVCIPFSPKTLAVYETYGCPSWFDKSNSIYLIPDSEKIASALWKKKTKALKKAINEIMDMKIT